MQKIQTFIYDGQAIEFDLSEDSNIMVNATEMAKAFNKKVENFTRAEQTEQFISAVLNAKKRFISTSPEARLPILFQSEMINSKKKSGTWMHRVLALKFAAWLSPEFEIWIYQTIDEILFGEIHSLKSGLKESAKRRKRIVSLKEELRENARYCELEQLLLEERQATGARNKFMKNQLTLFEEGE